MKTFLKIAGAAAGLSLLGSAASAAIIGFGGPVSSDGQGPMQIAPPATVLDDAPDGATNLGIQGFDEAQGVFLNSDLEFDAGMAGAGLTVDSHMIFLNSDGSNRVDHGTDGDDPVFFTFSGTIVGVMSDINGDLEAASTGLLGAAGTIYPATGFNNRGFEGNNVNTKTNDWYEISGNTLFLGMEVTEPGDWIRVVTVSEIPLPASAWMLGAAVLGAGAFARRKQKKA